jgi:hypothetical protein
VNTLIQCVDDLRQYGGRIVVFLCTNRLSVRIPTQAGRGFRFHSGHRSDLKPATIPR